MIKNTNNLKLLWIVFVEKCYRDSHHPIIVRRNCICVWYFNGVIIVVTFIIVFSSQFFMTTIF